MRGSLHSVVARHGILSWWRYKRNQWWRGDDRQIISIIVSLVKSKCAMTHSRVHCVRKFRLHPSSPRCMAYKPVMYVLIYGSAKLAKMKLQKLFISHVRCDDHQQCMQLIERRFKLTDPFERAPSGTILQSCKIDLLAVGNAGFLRLFGCGQVAAPSTSKYAWTSIFYMPLHDDRKTKVQQHVYEGNRPSRKVCGHPLIIRCVNGSSR